MTAEMKTWGFPNKTSDGGTEKEEKRNHAGKTRDKTRTAAVGGPYTKGEHRAASAAAQQGRAGQDSGGTGLRRTLLSLALCRERPRPPPQPARPRFSPGPAQPAPAPERPLPSPRWNPARSGGRCPSARPLPGCRSWRPPWPSPFALGCPWQRARAAPAPGRGQEAPRAAPPPQ